MSTASSPQIEERIVGRYALHREIASGGMATVYFGRLLGPVGFSKTVAIKRLHPQLAKDPEFVAMFLDEARLAARIQHPNVVSTLDVVALEGELLLVLEYVHGESLARLFRKVRKAKSSAPLKIVAAIAAGVLHGLHAAHEAKDEQGKSLGIVHRDVSPHNVIVGVDGVARVLDFGVAKAAGRLQSTRDGQLKGKLAYMAPEQIEGAVLDRRTDVYAASIVLWEFLAGRRLFDADNEGALLRVVSEGASSPPSAVSVDAPAELDAIVMKGLARDPARRYANGREMAVAIEERVGLASARQLGEWVTEIAGESLSRRAQAVKEIESITTVKPHFPFPVAGPGAASAEAPRPPTDGDGTPPPLEKGGAAREDASTAPALPAKRELSLSSAASSEDSSEDLQPAGVPRRRAPALPIAAGLVLLCGIGLLVVLLRGGPKAAPAEPSMAVPSITSASTAMLPPAASAVDPRGLVASTVTTAVTSVAPPELSGPSASVAAPPAAKAATANATARPNRSVTAPSSPPPAVPAPKNCDPPYTVTESGLRKLKPECL